MFITQTLFSGSPNNVVRFNGNHLIFRQYRQFLLLKVIINDKIFTYGIVIANYFSFSLLYQSGCVVWS